MMFVLQHAGRAGRIVREESFADSARAARREADLAALEKTGLQIVTLEPGDRETLLTTRDRCFASIREFFQDVVPKR